MISSAPYKQAKEILFDKVFTMKIEVITHGPI